MLLDSRRSGYKPLALLRIYLLGSLTCPVQSTDTCEATSGFKPVHLQLGGKQYVSQKCPGQARYQTLDLRINSPAFYYYTTTPSPPIYTNKLYIYINLLDSQVNHILLPPTSIPTKPLCTALLCFSSGSIRLVPM